MKTSELIETPSEEIWDYDETTAGMVRYDESAGDNQQWCTITQIVVESETDKQQLLMASKYIHNLHEIDSDFLAVNTIMHLYHNPDLIIVKPKS